MIEWILKITHIRNNWLEQATNTSPCKLYSYSIQEISKDKEMEKKEITTKRMSLNSLTQSKNIYWGPN